MILLKGETYIVLKAANKQVFNLNLGPINQRSFIGCYHNYAETFA